MLNVITMLCYVFYVYMDIVHGKFTSGKSDHTHTNIYHGNSVPCNRT